ncbi:hypothetical protein Pla111_17780 [Botrimarina hoheduenensis]|uniref:Uncharacterized protein n=1 Tax=Botrimarina hoheduenensis TaxID=2528000 RepID=A0A5C5W896_9BACT|nr:hypothetical protein Pla111_17780 [Botrimarina hoheduenensis]
MSRGIARLAGPLASTLREKIGAGRIRLRFGGELIGETHRDG